MSSGPDRAVETAAAGAVVAEGHGAPTLGLGIKIMLMPQRGLTSGLYPSYAA